MGERTREWVGREGVSGHTWGCERPMRRSLYLIHYVFGTCPLFVGVGVSREWRGPRVAEGSGVRSQETSGEVGVCVCVRVCVCVCVCLYVCLFVCLFVC